MSESVESALIRYLVDELGAAEAVTAETPIFERGIIASAQLLELVVFVEDSFGIVLRPIDLVPEKIKTVTAIANVVRQRIAESSGAG